MDLLGRGWEPRGLHKRRRLRPSIAQRLGVVAGNVPTRLKSPNTSLRSRQEEAGTVKRQDGKASSPPPKEKQGRQNDIGTPDENADDPLGKGKIGKGKGKGKKMNFRINSRLPVQVAVALKRAHRRCCTERKEET